MPSSPETNASGEVDEGGQDEGRHEVDREPLQWVLPLVLGKGSDKRFIFQKNYEKRETPLLIP